MSKKKAKSKQSWYKITKKLIDSLSFIILICNYLLDKIRPT